MWLSSLKCYKDPPKAKYLISSLCKRSESLSPIFSKTLFSHCTFSLLIKEQIPPCESAIHMCIPSRTILYFAFPSDGKLGKTISHITSPFKQKNFHFNGWDTNENKNCIFPVFFGFSANFFRLFLFSLVWCVYVCSLRVGVFVFSRVVIGGLLCWNNV